MLVAYYLGVAGHEANWNIQLNLKGSKHGKSYFRHAKAVAMKK